ncbi:MAG: hypothetical protein ACTSUE_20975 [Promethearchaeota archaeon]
MVDFDVLFAPLHDDERKLSIYAQFTDNPKLFRKYRKEYLREIFKEIEAGKGRSASWMPLNRLNRAMDWNFPVRWEMELIPTMIAAWMTA